MEIEIRSGRCGRVFVTLYGSFDAEAVDRVHDLLASADPSKPVVIDLRSIRSIDPLALAVLAGEVNVPRRRITIMGLSPRNQRLLSDLARRPLN